VSYVRLDKPQTESNVRKSNITPDKRQTGQTSDFPNVRLSKCQTFQTSDFPNIKLSKHQTIQRQSLQTSNFPNVKQRQTSDFPNVRLLNVRFSKLQTSQTSDYPMSDFFCPTGQTFEWTNVRLDKRLTGQTSDWTNVRLFQISNWNKCWTLQTLNIEKYLAYTELTFYTRLYALNRPYSVHWTRFIYFKLYTELT